MWFHGTLVLKTINGRNGPFNVAKLHLDVGEFAVKHPLIQQLDEGRYPATADVENFFIATRPANGASISEMAAWVRDLQIQADDAEETADAVPDPLMAPGLVDEPDDVPLTDAQPENEADPDMDAADAEVVTLFGDLASTVINRQVVKLDSAHSRFRAQIGWLKSNGFKYRAREQVWVPVDEQD